MFGRLVQMLLLCNEKSKNMAEQPTKYDVEPNLLYIDVLMLAYRLGHVNYEEQKAAMLSASRVATDAISFLTELERLGVSRQSRLFGLAGQILSSPAYYRSKYALILGLRVEGTSAASFLGDQRVLSLVEGILTKKQQDLFFETYWWFVHNHRPVFYDQKHGHCIGIYATDPQDNISTLARFEDYMQHLVNHKSKRIRERFADFPTDIVFAILKRAYL